MKRTIASLLFFIGLSFAVTTYAEIVTYSNDFTAKKMSGQYRVDDGSADYGTNLAPYYPNLRYYESGGSNFRYNYGENFMKLANASGCYGTLQMDASNFVSTATNYDLTLGDLVYECYNACSWNGAGAGGAHNGISINNNQMRFIYHPGYTNGAFRIEGDFGSCSNQNIGFTPAHNSTTDFTMMKLTIHRDDDAGNYVFTTQFGQATRTSEGWDTTGYTYSYVHTCPITTIDAAGGIKSIGPYGNHNNDACVTNLRLTAPFSDAAVAKAMEYSTVQQNVISNDQPTHWYKFDNPSTDVLKDYGSNPVDGTTLNIDSAIRDTEPIALFNGIDTRIDLTGTNNISGNWTAEFYINPHNISGRQALVSGDNGSLRWIMNSGKPGFTKWGAYDAEFKGPDGVSAFSYDLSQIVDEWIHVAYVRQGNDLFFYINGELVGKNASNQPAIDLPISRTIGSNGTGELFSGMVDDIAFYSSAMTADQVWTHAFPESIWYYNVNTADMFAENWTIDGTDKRGAWFIKNGESNTETYDKQVILNADGTFQIGADKNLILSGVVSGSGALEKIGAGKLTLSGDNDYTANMKISEGTLALTGDAKLTVNGDLQIGTDSGSKGSGTMTLSGNSSVVIKGTGTSFVGYNSGTSVLNVADNATFEQTNDGGLFYIGRDVVGTINQTGGKITLSPRNEIYIADSSGSSANINVSGGEFNVNPGRQIIAGTRGTATFNLSGTGEINADSLFVAGPGYDLGSITIVNQTGGTFNANAGIQYGFTNNQGAGIYNLSDGVLNATTITRRAESTNMKAQFNMSGGAANIDTLAVPTTFTGGTLNATTIDTTITTTDTFQQSGGVLTIGGTDTIGTTTITGSYLAATQLDAANVARTGTAFQDSNYNTTFLPSLAIDGNYNDSNFSHTGTGNVAHYWGVSYGEDVNFGKVVIYNRDFEGINSRLTDGVGFYVDVLDADDNVVWQSQTYKGGGHKGFTVDVPYDVTGQKVRVVRGAATTAPLNLTEVEVFAYSSVIDTSNMPTMKFEIQSLTDYDQLVLQGNSFDIGNGLAVMDVTALDPSALRVTPESITLFPLIALPDSVDISGEFADILLPSLEDGATWDLSALYTDGVIALVGRPYRPDEIPEPSTWALLILGAAGLLFWQKRKSNK